MKIFIIRHARPDWDRRDIPYDIHPGPMLTAKGEAEAEELAEYLKKEGVAKLYYSPFERAAATAKIVAARNEIEAVEESRLAEWRMIDEPERLARDRMLSTFQRAAEESKEIGPIGLVSHGGPIALLLQELGIDGKELAKYRSQFDTTNPLPPAGAWKVEQNPDNEHWKFELSFRPNHGLIHP